MNPVPFPHKPPLKIVATSYPTPRTLLVLGRVSNLPTVWSNCLSGWLLAGGGSLPRLLVLSAAASSLYVGGMYLNDAFDAAFDRQYRRERPIPSGAISESLVWQIGGALTVLGAVPLACMGFVTAILTLLLVLAILVYDAIHKAVAFSPVIMAICRLLLLLTAASTAEAGVTGIAVWSALALTGWIVGLSYVAKRESARGPLAYWPLATLAWPLVLAGIVNDGPYRLRGILLSSAVLAWTALCLRHSLVSTHRNIGRTVSGLLAGICLVDLLAAPPGPALIAFVLLFLAALLGQRFVPAT